MVDLGTASAPEAVGPGAFRWEVPDGWQQGPGAWGGLVVAGLLRAATAAEPDPARRLRSVSAALVAPLPVGPADLAVSVVRRGSATTTLAVRLTAAGAIRAQATVVLGAARAPDLPAWPAPTPPPAPPWADQPVVPLGPPAVPVFLQHLQVRPVRGVPAAGDADDALGWLNLARPPAALDEVTVAALADAWWPATIVRLAAGRPVATLTFDAIVTGDPAGLDPAVPLLHHGEVTGLRDGYVLETRRLWSAAGDLLVHNVQTVAVIR